MELFLGVAGALLLSAIVLLIVLAIFSPTTAQVVSDPPKLALVDPVAAVDVGDGVFFLNVADGPTWVVSLRRFIQEHPALRITAIAPASEGRVGAYSRLLVTEHRHECPCHVGD